MAKNDNEKNQTTRWIIGGVLAVYGLQASGWRRWAAWTVASSLLGITEAQKNVARNLLGGTPAHQTN